MDALFACLTCIHAKMIVGMLLLFVSAKNTDCRMTVACMTTDMTQEGRDRVAIQWSGDTVGREWIGPCKQAIIDPYTRIGIHKGYMYACVI